MLLGRVLGKAQTSFSLMIIQVVVKKLRTFGAEHAYQATIWLGGSRDS